MLNVRKVKASWQVAAVAVGAAVGVALATTSAYASPSAAGAASTAVKPLPMSTSWATPQQGIVLSYPSRNPGARPSLIVTKNGGRTWQKLPAPPVPFPANNDTPDATWVPGVIAITDGTHVVDTVDGGRHWSSMRLYGAAANRYVGHLTLSHGRVYTLVSSYNASGTAATAVYSGLDNGNALRTVPGLSVSGGITYGDITAIGGLQVSLGSDYAKEGYWLSGNGTRFAAAPRPCPVTTSVLLGGVRDGRPVALCSDGPSEVAPGETVHQIWTAAHLGGHFTAASPAFTGYNQQAFAAASDRNLTIASAAGVDVTFNVGRTWTAELPQPSGSFWQDLAFPSSSVGVAVDSTINSQSQLVGYVYVTTSAGRTWHPLTLP